jgi:two-component system NtrC family response regulator
MKPRILLIDDDESFREVMRFQLDEEGYLVETASDGKEGLALFQKQPQSLVITDLKMPQMDGLTLLQEIHKRSPATLVIVITAFGDIETAVEAMKAGAFDFIPKPTSREHVKMVIRKASEHIALKEKVQKYESIRPTETGKIIYQSAVMEKLINIADRVAASEATVLLLGESGTGKEVIAKRIHLKSERRECPFIPVNCAAIPKELLESELFGHVKGAFTGATRDRKGKFQQASGGTIFLDEIGELPGELQPRLLRVLEEQTVDVVGGEKSLAVDVRIIAATNRNLEDAVKQGSFRKDLYFRLNVVPIEIPPLRERQGDIVVLADHFLTKYSKGSDYRLTKEIIDSFEAYDWPGNVRELENTCQRLALLSQEGELGTALLSSPISLTSQGDDLIFKIPAEGISLEDLERQIVAAALKKNNFNQSQTARFLKIPRHVLLYRIEKHQIPTARLRRNKNDPRSTQKSSRDAKIFGVSSMKKKNSK